MDVVNLLHINSITPHSKFVNQFGKQKVPLVIMFLTKHITRGVVHINNTLKLIGFEDLYIKDFKIDKSETEIHIHIKLRVKPCECSKLVVLIKLYITLKKEIVHFKSSYSMYA